MQEYYDYVIQYNDKTALDKLNHVANVRYEGHFINVVFVSITKELAEEIAKWNEIVSIELEDNPTLFQ
jgi:hypothetical protein